MKSLALVPEPSRLVTVIGPVVAPLGTFARNCVSKSTVNVNAGVPLKETPVVPVKFTPVSVTSTPAVPFVGVKELIPGINVTVKLPALVPVPAALVTLIGPVVAPLGTFARTCVSESTVKLVADVPLNETFEAPLKLTPVIVTSEPSGPLVGVNELTVGG